MDINKIYNENNLDTMNKMPNEFIDLTVTSPPPLMMILEIITVIHSILKKLPKNYIE